MLSLFNVQNTKGFALCTLGTFLVFCVIYAAVYTLTAKTYGRIVGQSGDRA
jgi:putative ABC transport system permease protein